MRLDKDYNNVVGHGGFLRYVINPAKNLDLQPYLSKLTIRLHSMLGDADLFVSLTNPAPDVEDNRWSSRRKSVIDQVTIEEQGGESLLNRPIYFSVFGATAA